MGVISITARIVWRSFAWLLTESLAGVPEVSVASTLRCSCRKSFAAFEPAHTFIIQTLITDERKRM